MRLRRSDHEIDFVGFVEQRSAALFRTAFMLTGDPHTAEDLLQEALEKACRHWRRVADSDSPEAYVRRIVVNLANDRWRRLRRGDQHQPLLLPDEQADPHDAYHSVELREELLGALHALPIGMRTVVVLRYLHDMDDQEIAQTIGVSPSSVRSQLARGLAKLRGALPRETASPLPSTTRERTR